MTAILWFKIKRYVLENLPYIPRFSGVGISGMALFYVTLLGLTEFGGVWYLYSVLAAGMVNTLWNFFLQKLWTFRNRAHGWDEFMAQAGKYFLMMFSFMAIDAAFVYSMVEFLHVPYWTAQILINAILAGFGYWYTHRIFKGN